MEHMHISQTWMPCSCVTYSEGMKHVVVCMRGTTMRSSSAGERIHNEGMSCQIGVELHWQLHLLFVTSSIRIGRLHVNCVQ